MAIQNELSKWALQMSCQELVSAGVGQELVSSWSGVSLELVSSRSGVDQELFRRLSLSSFYILRLSK